MLVEMHRTILLTLLTGAIALPQTSSGTLSGEVRDESGDMISDVRISASQTGRGVVRTAITDNSGRYQLPDLNPGEYVVSAEKTGFRTTTATGIVLQVDQGARLDFDLKLGAEHDSVTVNALVSPLQTNEASEGYYLEARTITGLPLVGRNILSLVTLGPGAIPRQLGGFLHDIINDVQPARGAVALNPPVNGARPTMNAYVLDGAYNTDRNAFVIAVRRRWNLCRSSG